MPMRPYPVHLAPTFGALTYAAKVGDIISLEQQALVGQNFRAKGGGNGREAVHYAAEGGQVYSMQTLKDHGADVRARDCFGWEPVHYAAANANDALLEKLKVLGASMRARDNEGKEPAHLAAEWGHMETLRMLRKLGADLFALDGEMRAPRDYARRKDVFEYFDEVERNISETRTWLTNTKGAALAKLPSRESSAREGEPMLGPKYKFKGHHTVRGVLHVLGQDVSGTDATRRGRLMGLKGSLENTLNRTGSLNGLSFRHSTRSSKNGTLDRSGLDRSF